MKLKSFRIKNYKSIQDTGDIFLDKGRIATFAGQNESGKSSILEALDAYERSVFDPDSVPFDFDDATQEVLCTYAIEDSDEDFWEEIESSIVENYKLTKNNAGDILDISKIKKTVKEFTITRFTEFADRKNAKTSINDSVFQIIKSAIVENSTDSEIKKEDGTIEIKKEKKKIFDLPDDNNTNIADILWKNTPRIILFNDFCDLLPDKFSIADLKADKKDAKGYKAVRNFEKISNAKFLDLYKLDDLKRDSTEEKHNETISINFTKAWKQQIHGDNKVKLAYKFEKREPEDSSFVMFYVETKNKQKIRPRMRSKGLVWFLSFWMELQASGNENDLIILADEPGLYLHIKAQADILSVFESLAESGHQIIYSTHSPNLIKTDHLERISLVINDQNKGTIIEGVTTSKIDSQNKQDALQPVANAIGFSVCDFALSNKKTVILEGVSDLFYYLGMRKLLKRKDSYALVPGIGVRKQHTLISFCLGYGIDWVAVFDDDSKKGSDSQKTFADIKEHLFNGDDAAAETKMKITSGISCVENMFTVGDMKLIDSKLVAKTSPSESIGDKRKVIFAKSFYEKVESGEITKKKLDANTVTNFGNVFDWIEKNLSI
jgi:predicted ATP-dependent endonuclease of OLD family